MGQIKSYHQDERGEWVRDQPKGSGAKRGGQRPARVEEPEAEDPRPSREGARPPRRRRSTAVIPGGCAERGLLLGLQVAAWALILLSVIGTFYGVQGKDAPLKAPWEMVAHVRAAWPIAVVSLLGQGVLSLVQWGSRGLSRHNYRWWLLYVVALALSVWWNWAAYGDPLIALGVPWLVALGVIIAGDVLPELTLVQEE